MSTCISRHGEFSSHTHDINPTLCDLCGQPDVDQPCVRPSTRWGTCIEALAAGWILTSDLCPACTRTFMAALDVTVGPLKWHANYLERAGR